MPFNPYRPHRFPDPISRSRFPVNTPLPNTRMMPSSTMPPKAWGVPVNRNMAYQPQNTPVSTSRQGYIHHQQQEPYEHQLYRDTTLKARALTRSTQIEAPYYQPCITPERQVTNDLWDEGMGGLVKGFLSAFILTLLKHLSQTLDLQFPRSTMVLG